MLDLISFFYLGLFFESPKLTVLPLFFLLHFSLLEHSHHPLHYLPHNLIHCLYHYLFSYVNLRTWRVFTLANPTCGVPPESTPYGDDYPFSMRVMKEKLLTVGDMMNMQVWRCWYSCHWYSCFSCRCHRSDVYCHYSLKRFYCCSPSYIAQYSLCRTILHTFNSFSFLPFTAPIISPS